MVIVQKFYYVVYGWMFVQGIDLVLVFGFVIVWQIELGDMLLLGQFVMLCWDNGVGQIFCCIYELDDKFLFIVMQMLENIGIVFFVVVFYGILVWYGKFDMQNFFVLYEGVVGMIDGKLFEEKYKVLIEFDLIVGEGLV